MLSLERDACAIQTPTTRYQGLNTWTYIIDRPPPLSLSLILSSSISFTPLTRNRSRFFSSIVPSYLSRLFTLFPLILSSLFLSSPLSPLSPSPSPSPFPFPSPLPHPPLYSFLLSMLFHNTSKEGEVSSPFMSTVNPFSSAISLVRSGGEPRCRTTERRSHYPP